MTSSCIISMHNFPGSLRIQTTDFQPRFLNSNSTSTLIWGLCSVNDLWVTLVRVLSAHRGHIYVSSGSITAEKRGGREDLTQLALGSASPRRPHPHNDLVLGVRPS